MLFSDSTFYTYVAIPLLIFMARVADVTIGTIRIVFVSKGMKLWAPVLGFFEILIWLMAMSKIFENLDNWLYFVAYAGGFAMGNFVGLKIEERLALGYINIRIITQKSGSELMDKLTSAGYGITYMDAEGSRGPVHVIYCVAKRKEIVKITDIIKQYNPKAFFTLEDIRFANSGVFPIKSVIKRNPIPLRKAK
nr:DUF2179 domain-containing protein [uncultured Carboxylicivirga sp.]